jgi:hypothetical protein
MGEDGRAALSRGGSPQCNSAFVQTHPFGRGDRVKAKPIRSSIAAG